MRDEEIRTKYYKPETCFGSESKYFAQLNFRLIGLMAYFQTRQGAPSQCAHSLSEGQTRKGEKSHIGLQSPDASLSGGGVGRALLPLEYGQK